MKIVIIGAVAAGTKTAAKLRRALPEAEVVIYTRSEDISYASCALPYYVGGAVGTREELIVNTPERFSALTGVEVHTRSEMTALDAAAKTVTVNGERVSYDKLVLALGAEPVVPDAHGMSLRGVFTVRTPEDAVAIREYAGTCRRAVIVGAGFIGLEMAENLMAAGLEVTVADASPQILPGAFDREMADYLCRRLREKGMRIMTGVSLESVTGSQKAEGVRTSAGSIPADMVIVSVGIRPATAFLSASGLETDGGCIVTDQYAATNLEDVYAVGDCAMVKSRITGKSKWSAMGSTANIAGRALALTLSGTPTPYGGCLGTGILKLADDLCAARTGLSAAEAREAGYDVITTVTVSDDKPHYYPGAGNFITKLTADRQTHRLLGAQIIGQSGVDKMSDIAVVAISAGLTADELVTMDFSYAPPFSTAIHPFAVACTVMTNKLNGVFESITPDEYAAGAADDYTLIDAYPEPTVPGADWLDLTDIAADKYAKDAKLLLVCSRGRRAYLLQNKLKALGFTGTGVLEGGGTFNVIRHTLPAGERLDPAEIRRVKGLGCLQDKRFADVFNVRVITRNGKITADEHRAVAEAAERFGSGEITMTTRLTMEIQGVRYGNIDPLIAFLAQHGLETGGTGSRVRPVVSCKGTTCQYGLIDTFGLSEKIHVRFYRGYHDVTLPHKFKIAVGGCPNNCVKPDLNDLGIVGQRVPVFDFQKCRGCKSCQVGSSCPIGVATLSDGMLTVDSAACNGCGRCRDKCPFGVTGEYINGYRIYIGGRWGKKIANGRPLSRLFTDENEVLDTVERAILFFRDEGVTGERFADTVARLGFEYTEEKLLHSGLDRAKILEKKVTGGASC